MQLEITGDGEFIRLAGNSDEVGRQRPNVAKPAARADFVRNADEKIFVIVIEARQGADGVAGISPDTELGDAANIDGDAHRVV